MFLWTLFIALIFSRSASGVNVKVAAGDEAVFSPTKPLPSPTNSIAWKHKSIKTVIVIEWDEDGFNTPNDRFNGITTLDKETGEMTIKRVDVNHSGEYFYEVNSKDQGEKFTLTVANRVQKPVINIEKSEVNSDVAYLSCEYSETIIWRNSAGETLRGSAISPKGESITVKKNGAPGNFYTCSLRNDVSEETSDPIYEKDLFKDVSGGGPWWVVFIIIPLAAAVGSVLGYKFNTGFRECVQHCPCFKGQGDNDPKTIGYQPTPNNDKDDAVALKEVSTETKSNEHVETEEQSKSCGLATPVLDEAEGPGGNDLKTIDEAPEKTSAVTNTNDEAPEKTSAVTNTNGPGDNGTNTNDDSTPAANNKSTEGKPDTTEA